MAFPCFDGIYLPKQENEFLHQVMDELGKYKQKGNRKSVLLFPCLPSRLRYLIHKTIEDLPELTTFSVGESWCRRVVVCHSELRYKHCITNNYSSRKSSTYVHYLVGRTRMVNLNLQFHPEAEDLKGQTNLCTCHELLGRGSHLKEAVSFYVDHVHNDFSIYENVYINPDEFRHVIEIYDFPSMFKTDDLLDAFTEYRWEQRVHLLNHFHLLLFPFTKKSKGKAMRRPVKERPRTDSAVARRMVTRALGLPGRGRARPTLRHEVEPV
uniref:R3H domain-containing protein n=1 Tax=Echeneis naucrates TaxID=173247 RepID=A0A665TMN7_ECHNA